MEKPKHRSSPDTKSGRPQPVHKDADSQPIKQDEDVLLETYEHSPKRPGGDERSEYATPDGPLPGRERATPD
jgi:hypothetical protein